TQAHPSDGRRAEPAESAARLPIPPAMPVRDHFLQDRRTASRGSEGSAMGGMPRAPIQGQGKRSRFDSLMSEHRPYVASEATMPEFTWPAVVVGAVLGIVFGASSLYLVLKVGMTVSASIPIAVLSITIFRLFGKL